jgi:hypothetical protein
MTGTVAGPSDDDTTGTRSPRRGPSRFLTWLLVVATVLSVLAAFAGYAAARRHNPVYRSVGALSFDQPQKLAKSTNPGIIDKLGRIRITYIGLARTDAVLQPVSQQLNLPVGKIRSSLFLAADKASLLLYVGAETGRRDLSRRIASAMLSELVTTVDEQQTRAKIADRDRLVASIVIQPLGAQQVAPSARLPVTTAVAVGLLVLLGVLGIGSLVRRRTV